MPLRSKQQAIEDAIGYTRRTLERELPDREMDEWEWIKLIAAVVAEKWMHLRNHLPNF